jgi:cytochrome d ubiquinol oxidase subunit I
MEVMYEGKSNAGLVAIGLLKDSNKKIGDKVNKEFYFKIEIPDLLSVLTGGDKDAYVPGITDLVLGNEKRGIMSVPEKIQRGQFAKKILIDYKKAVMAKDTKQIEALKAVFKDNEFHKTYFRYFGYSSIDKPEDVIPDVPLSFYSFHTMVILGFLFIMIFAVALYLLFKGTISVNRWFLWIALLSIPLPYIAGELGWILTEAGRQPWIIQDLMPVSRAVSQITPGSVITTFILFAVLFMVLLISEISIMVKQVKTGPVH